MYVGVLIIIIIGFFTAETQPITMVVGEGQFSWALFGGASLLCGGFIDLQQWQRAKRAIAEGKTKAFAVGGALFAFYMLLLTIMVQFQFTTVMSVILLIVALMITTSTFDSIGVAFQEIGGNKVGAVLGIIAVASWQIVYAFGIIEIWSMYATFRLVVVSVMIAMVLVWAHGLKSATNK